MKKLIAVILLATILCGCATTKKRGCSGMKHHNRDRVTMRGVF